MILDYDNAENKTDVMGSIAEVKEMVTELTKLSYGYVKACIKKIETEKDLFRSFFKDLDEGGDSDAELINSYSYMVRKSENMVAHIITSGLQDNKFDDILKGIFKDNTSALESKVNIDELKEKWKNVFCKKKQILI
jgi:hypothetical protein